MTAIAAIAVVTAAIVGGSADHLEIDRGMVDGLDRGDRGAVYYTLLVRGESKRIDVGSGELTRVDDRTATLRMTDGDRAAPGYHVDFSPPSGRFSPTRLLDLARTRQAEGRGESALLYLDLIRERLGDDPLAGDQIREIEADLDARGREDQEKENVGYFLAAARHYLERAELDTASSYAEKARALAPNEAGLAEVDRDIEAAREAAATRRRHATMTRLAADEYSIGLDATEAEYFNQQPRRGVRLGPIWIDRSPVSVDDYRRFRSGYRTPRNGVPPFVTDVSFADAMAYCRSLGKRLPDELEWEAAAAASLLESPDGLNEWTSSFYQPYPGNSRPEEAYGDRYRVLRRLREGNLETYRRRRFLDPGSRHASVGFRCAEDAG